MNFFKKNWLLLPVIALILVVNFKQSETSKTKILTGLENLVSSAHAQGECIPGGHGCYDGSMPVEYESEIWVNVGTSYFPVICLVNAWGTDCYPSSNPQDSCTEEHYEDTILCA